MGVRYFSFFEKFNFNSYTGKGHICVRRVFSLITEIRSESFNFALSLLLAHLIYMKTNIIVCDRQWFT